MITSIYIDMATDRVKNIINTHAAYPAKTELSVNHVHSSVTHLVVTVTDMSIVVPVPLFKIIKGTKV